MNSNRQKLIPSWDVREICLMSIEPTFKTFERDATTMLGKQI